jgi:hypothetical protein
MENQKTNALAVKSAVPIGNRGITPTDMDGLWRFATAVHKSGLSPKGLETAEAVFVAIEMGLEVGLPMMAALQNIAVINGRPTIWGDAQLAVCRGTGELTEFTEWYEEKGTKLPRNPATFTDETCAVCRVQREGYAPAETSFSVADAKRASLWGKTGPWTQYPARMLRFRARSFALRDQFGDALRGLRTAEEVMDDPVEVARNVTPKVKFAKVSAPAESLPEPAPVELIPDPNAELVLTLLEAGYTLDHLNRYLILEQETASEFASFDDIPAELRTKLTKAKAAVVRGIKAMEGGSK